MLLFQTMLLFSIDKLNLYDFQIHNSNITLYETKKGMLINHLSGDTLYLIDNQGKLLAKNDRVGKGPYELEQPVVLGEYKDILYVLSHSERILRMGYDLVPMERDADYKRLPHGGTSDIVEGFLINDTEFLFSRVLSRHLVGLHRWQDGAWLVPKQSGPNTITEELVRQYGESNSFRLNNSLLFAFKISRRDRDYEVHVYDMKNHGQEIMVLMGTSHAPSCQRNQVSGVTYNQVSENR